MWHVFNRRMYVGFMACRFLEEHGGITSLKFLAVTSKFPIEET